MRLFICLFLLGTQILNNFAQNLIPNPGFEQCDLCDNIGFKELYIGQGANNPIDWTAASAGTPDFRSETPRTGKHYGGFFLGFNKYEYLTNHFVEPLKEGSVYRFKFYIRPDQRSPSYALDAIGIHILTGLPKFPQTNLLDQIIPQFQSPDNDHIKDFSYKEYSFEYTACGGEDHFIVGRFKPWEDGDTVFIGTTRPSDSRSAYAYYCVDDFEMIEIRKVEYDLIPEKLEVCHKNAINLNLPGTNTYKTIKWSTGETSQNIQFNGEGLVKVSVQLDNPCKTIIEDSVIINRTSVELTINDIISGLNTICQGQTNTYLINLTGTNFTKQNIKSILWSNGSNAEQITTNTPGKIELIIEMNDSCQTKIKASKLVSLALTGMVIKVNPKEICFGDTATLEIILNKDYFPDLFLWNNGLEGKEIEIYKPGFYEVTTNSICGEKKANITVPSSNKNKKLELHLPNVIIPGNESKNRDFGIILDDEKAKILSMKMQIFNRWGKKVFETTDKDRRWLPDAVMPVETYLYVIEYSYQACTDIQNAKAKGNISVIK